LGIAPLGESESVQRSDIGLGLLRRNRNSPGRVNNMEKRRAERKAMYLGKSHIGLYRFVAIG
jgi:hypothetical protein